MTAFHEVSFPAGIAFGTTGGPERRVEIVQMTSGRERRNARFAHSRRRYDAGTGIRSAADLAEIVAFFEARRGSLHGFRFRDPFDDRSCALGATPAATDQAIGAGDGARATFQLVKRYGIGAEAYLRPIVKPVASSVRIAVDGSELAPGSFAVNAAGEVTVAPGFVPASGEVVTAGFLFDVPVRFDIERLEIGLTAFEAGRIPSIPLTEIMP